jgi:predicted MFS family arabinose efflux permease
MPSSRPTTPLPLRLPGQSQRSIKNASNLSFAVMMSITNLATASADNVGSFLFEHFFHNRLTPLILVSAAFTAFAFVLVPLLHLGDKPQGQPAGAAAS